MFKVVKQTNSFGENRFTLDNKKSNFIALLGANGSGKSMSLRDIAEELSKDDKLYIQFASKQDDVVKNANPFAKDDDYLSSLTSAFTSEGERIATSFVKWMKKNAMDLSRKVKESNDTDMYWLLDEIDSGFSYDRLRVHVDFLQSVYEIEKKNGIEVTFVLTVNSYELLSLIQKLPNHQVWSVEKNRDITGEISSFEDFVNLYESRYLYLKEHE